MAFAFDEVWSASTEDTETAAAAELPDSCHADYRVSERPRERLSSDQARCVPPGRMSNDASARCHQYSSLLEKTPISGPVVMKRFPNDVITSWVSSLVSRVDSGVAIDSLDLQ